jgi:hypothetical protein
MFIIRKGRQVSPKVPIVDIACELCVPILDSVNPKLVLLYLSYHLRSTLTVILTLGKAAAIFFRASKP